MTDFELIQKTIELSAESSKKGFPVGAVIAIGGKVVASGASNGKVQHDPTSHAETDAIRSLCQKLKTRNLKGYTLYSSMEPCSMCFGAAYWSNINRIVYAVGYPKLNSMHFDNSAGLLELAKLSNKNIEIVQIKELENQALDVIKKWELKTYGR